MRFVRLLVLSLAAALLPKLVSEIKGPGVHQFSKTLLPTHEQPANEAARAALSQPFFYWGKGSQSFVFFSEDGRTVLKIPRAGKAKEGLISRVFHIKRWRENLWESMKAASETCFSETALLYAHYGETPCCPPLLLYDRLHRPLHAKQIPFVLQYRKPLLSEALLQAEEEEAKRILLAFIHLIKEESSKGWMSQDNAFDLNFGYEEGRAWRIDVGSYVKATPKALPKAVKPVRHWLKVHRSSLCAWFEEEVKKG